jgi:hypothetical protein
MDNQLDNSCKIIEMKQENGPKIAIFEKPTEVTPNEIIAKKTVSFKEIETILTNISANSSKNQEKSLEARLKFLGIYRYTHCLEKAVGNRFHSMGMPKIAETLQKIINHERNIIDEFQSHHQKKKMKVENSEADIEDDELSFEKFVEGIHIAGV